MNDSRSKNLQRALIVAGLIAIFGVLPLMWLWPAGFRWQPVSYESEMMLVAVYATLGVYLIKASRNPMEHKSLIWFAVWSSVVHGLVMLVMALIDPMERTHLVGDVPILLIIAAVIAYLMPRENKAAK